MSENKFLVGVQGDDIVLMQPVQRLSKKDALILAAWLVVLADTNESFIDILAEIQKS